MTRVARRVVWSLVTAVVVLGIGIVALLTLWPRGPQGVPPRLVPAAWAQFRTSPGHAFHVGQGKAECRDCHNVERDGFKNPGTDVCTKCHAKESAKAHHGGQGLAATSCLTCHQFAPGLPAATCIGCHAKPEGDLPAVVQHATAECTTCHRPHDEPSIVPADCTSCHDERAAKHGEHAGSKGCLDCHGAHRPATAAPAACSSCHAQPAGPRPAGHDACIGCHQAHDFVAGGEQACIRCHGEKTTLAASVAPAHAICTSCHTPHDPARAAGACVRCHQDIQVEHGAGGACVTCHEPHGDDPAVVALSCTSCHAKVALFDTAAHAGGVACEGCHKPHQFAGLDPKGFSARTATRARPPSWSRTRATAIARPVTARRWRMRLHRPRRAAPATPPRRSLRPRVTSAAWPVTNRMRGNPWRPARPVTRTRPQARTRPSREAARRAIAPTAPAASRLRPGARPATCLPHFPRFTRPPDTPSVQAATCRRTSRRA